MKVFKERMTLYNAIPVLVLLKKPTKLILIIYILHNIEY